METSCLKWAQEKPISFIYSYRELSHVKKNNLMGFTCRITSPVEHKLDTSPTVPPRAHTHPSSLGLQFLKAPHLLALAMNSFSRGPSICQNAAVCVTSVK